MDKRHKDILRKIVGQLRIELAGGEGEDDRWLRGDLDRELERLGIGPDGSLTQLALLPGLTPQEQRAHEAARAVLDNVAADRVPEMRSEVVERAAYTWINRLLALRAMETRGLMDETLRANPAYGGASEALFVLRQTAPARCAGPDGGWWAVIEDACQAQAAALPGLFNLADPVAALRPSTAGLQRCIQLVGTAPAGYTLDECDAAFADPDAIGWAYQFYQEDAKKRTYAKMGAGAKASTRADIAAVTQLFTEPYMVDWLLQNSLGRSYHELYPDSTLPDTWEYYIRELPNDEPPPRCVESLTELTFMDPCCGSGHFERVAFDMYAAMYREQESALTAAEIADRILTRHLHGIDIDPRAVQLTALTLYLRARELIRDERRAQRLSGPGEYHPPVMHLAATPTGLPEGALQRHLARHPEDQVLAPFLEGIFHALEHADILGSLLRPSEELDQAVAALAKTGTLAMDFDPDAMALRREITELASSDPESLKRTLLDRIAASFAEDAGDSGDVAGALFGHEAGEGVRLLRLLGERYAVVATNPPYLGNSGMSAPLKRHVEMHYSTARRDLYSAFIQRCLTLSSTYGRAAVVTMQSWAFLVAYSEFRRELIETSSLERLALLGSGAFSKDAKLHTGVAVMCAVAANRLPHTHAQLVAVRAVSGDSPDGKTAQLQSAASNVRDPSRFVRHQADFAPLPQEVLAFWLPTTFYPLFRDQQPLGSLAFLGWGASTSDNARFVRAHWEVTPGDGRWLGHRKGGGYRKWSGHNEWVLDWGDDGARPIGFILERYPYLGRNYEIKLRPHTFDLPGWCYTKFANGCLSFRVIDRAETTNAASPGAFVAPPSHDVGALLNSRLSSFLVRAICNKMDVESGYIAQIPLPPTWPVESLRFAGEICVRIKGSLVEHELTERAHNPSSAGQERVDVAAVLHLVESAVELVVHDLYGVEDGERTMILQDTGIPPGFYPVVLGYDAIPVLPPDLAIPSLPRAVIDCLDAHDRIHPAPAELDRIKARLKALYEAGPGAKDVPGFEDDEGGNGEDGDDEATSGAYIPIPTETFIEELSVKMQLHPISVYWLLEELRAEGARCQPEELRVLEDRLSVLILRLLGHRWPKQIEAGEPVPEWADEDGIIPVTSGCGEPTLAERLRGRLRAEDGDLGAQKTEALLTELTGLSLEEWVRRQFYPRHIRQFKQRPIAWHLASQPTSGGKKAGRRLPAFECFLYYHVAGLDALTRIRTLYVEPLMGAERQRLADARQSGDEAAAALAYDRLHELEDFNGRLRQVEEAGFACKELDAYLANETLDRWAGDGFVAPASDAAFAAQERAWRVDINDGVRVNVAPVQLAGLLAANILNAKDAKKAIADRARWRADERRWVREGKLPRCGWMPESVPESPRWTELAPEREAERLKLEEKRKKVREELGTGADGGAE